MGIVSQNECFLGTFAQIWDIIKSTNIYMSVSSYVRKKTITQTDYDKIADMPYKDQIEIFKLRNIKLQRLNDMEANPDKYKQSQIMRTKDDFQKVYNTRTRKEQEKELQMIEEAEQRKEVKSKLRSAKKS